MIRSRIQLVEQFCIFPVRELKTNRILSLSNPETMIVLIERENNVKTLETCFYFFLFNYSLIAASFENGSFWWTKVRGLGFSTSKMVLPIKSGRQFILKSNWKMLGLLWLKFQFVTFASLWNWQKNMTFRVVHSRSLQSLFHLKTAVTHKRFLFCELAACCEGFSQFINNNTLLN